MDSAAGLLPNGKALDGHSRTQMTTKVSLIEVVDALEIATDEVSSFVSKRTGQVVTLSHEAMHLAEEDSKDDLPWIAYKTSNPFLCQRSGRRSWMLSTEAVPSVNSRAPFDGYAWRTPGLRSGVRPSRTLQGRG